MRAITSARKVKDAAFHADEAAHHAKACGYLLEMVMLANGEEEARAYLKKAKGHLLEARKRARVVEAIMHKPLGTNMDMSRAVYEYSRGAWSMSGAAMDSMAAIENHVRRKWDNG